MKTLLAVFVFNLSFNAFAVSDQTLKYLKTNNIILKEGVFQDSDVDAFLAEYHKMPIALRTEMIKKGAKIHLISGQSVTQDKTWKGEINTWDGRKWDDIPGSGGQPCIKTPTRIVVNRMNEGHGSINLFLHEHAHAIDSTYKIEGVSKSKQWKKVLSNSANATDLLKKLCLNDYCLQSEEGFAELFAHYFHSAESRLEIENEVPLIAEFFRTFSSIKKLPEVNVSPKYEAISHHAARQFDSFRAIMKPKCWQANCSSISHTSRSRKLVVVF